MRQDLRMLGELIWLGVQIGALAGGCYALLLTILIGIINGLITMIIIFAALPIGLIYGAGIGTLTGTAVTVYWALVRRAVSLASEAAQQRALLGSVVVLLLINGLVMASAGGLNLFTVIIPACLAAGFGAWSGWRYMTQADEAG